MSGLCPEPTRNVGLDAVSWTLRHPRAHPPGVPDAQGKHAASNLRWPPPTAPVAQIAGAVHYLPRTAPDVPHAAEADTRCRLQIRECGSVRNPQRASTTWPSHRRPATRLEFESPSTTNSSAGSCRIRTQTRTGEKSSPTPGQCTCDPPHAGRGPAANERCSPARNPGGRQIPPRPLLPGCTAKHVRVLLRATGRPDHRQPPRVILAEH